MIIEQGYQGIECDDVINTAQLDSIIRGKLSPRRIINNVKILG